MLLLRFQRLFQAAFCLAWLFAGSPSFAFQNELPTIEDVEQSIAALEGSTDPDATAKVERLRHTIQALSAAQAMAARTTKFEAEAAEAPALLRSLRREIASTPKTIPIPEVGALPLEDLTALAKAAEAELTTARDHVGELEALADKRAVRKAALPGEIAEAQQALSAVNETLLATPSSPENQIRRHLLLAQATLREAELEALTAERGTYEARSELLPLRQDRAARNRTIAENRFETLQQRLNSRREQEGETAAAQADTRFAQAAERIPQLAPLLETNKKLSALRSGNNSVPRQLTATEQALDADRELLEEIRSRANATDRRERAGGLTEGMGFILRRDYEWLPRDPYLRSQAAARAKALATAELESIHLDEKRGELRDIDAAARELLGTDADSDAFETATTLLTLQRESLDVVNRELEALTTTLYEHAHLTSEIQGASSSYKAYIEQRILWVKSCPKGFIPSMLSIPQHIGEMSRSVSWATFWKELQSAIRAEIGTILLVLAWVAFLIAGRRFLLNKREEMGKQVRSYKSDRYIYTIRAIAQTLFLALPMPLLAWALALLLQASSQELVRSAGSALRDTTYYWLTLRFLGGLLAPKSVGTVHFRWAPAKIAAVRGALRWFIPFAVPLGFIVLTLDRQSVTDWSDSVGRASFVVIMAALSFGLHQLLREESHLWGSSLAMGKTLLTRTHRIWSLAASGLPLLLVLLALGGYYYTALQFEQRTRYSLGLALGLVIINALLLRWLFITRRRLAVNQALEARAKKEKEEEESASGAVTDTAAAAFDTDKVDIPAVDAQTRQLFRSSITLATVFGLYLIWSATLPALQGLNRVQILPHPAIVDGKTPAPIQPLAATTTTAPNESAETAPSPTPLSPTGLAPTESSPAEPEGLPSSLTLADILLAAILLALTLIAARNLPALLELALLERLPLDGGSRYAVTTLLRYIIFIIGVGAISSALGIGWQHIQWLAAALTFGLAFGLQEIFANFVSGIIILIERPVRVGDIVTVGTTEGRITQLRMRATTILDWDRKEYLVPNKEFITGSVVNWTLSDPITRIIISVGIAYGSDTAKARNLLLKVARREPMVVKDPEPSALFRSFGDSTLDFELRVFVENRDMWPALIDQLHTKIDNEFRKAGIEIAFPQRDLHVRTAPGLKGHTLEPAEE